MTNSAHDSRPTSSGCRACTALPARDLPATTYPPPIAGDEWRAVDRIRGALLGVAIGDALGGIVHRGQPIPAAPAVGSLRAGGATQLTLLTAEALVRMRVRAEEKGIGPAWDIIRSGLERWAYTQGLEVKHLYVPVEPAAWPDGWVVREHSLHARVSGFSAEREALRSTVDPSGEIASGGGAVPRVTGSNGAGGIVRIASAGLLFESEWSLKVGEVAAGYTHDGVLGRVAAGALARVISGIMRGHEVEVSLTEAAGALRNRIGVEPILCALGPSGVSVISDSSAVEALCSGIAAVRACDADPLAAITRAVASGGTAAGVVAGALAGVVHGATGLPPEWRVAPTSAGAIEAMADAIGVAHRTFLMRRSPVPGKAYEEDWRSDGGPGVDLLWPRYPGV